MSLCSTGFTGVAWLLNIIFLYKPILGAPKSTFMDWVKDNDGRWIAYAAGTICGIGTAPSAACVRAGVLKHFQIPNLPARNPRLRSKECPSLSDWGYMEAEGENHSCD